MRHQQYDTVTLFTIIEAIQRRFEAQGLTAEVADAAIKVMFEPSRRWNRRTSPPIGQT